MPEVLQHIVSLGFAPQTVVDVGVADGTYDLYNSFPVATHVLIEPLEEYSKSLDEISAQFKTIPVRAAASDHSGEATINVHKILTGSSLLKEVEGAHVDGTPRRVPVVTVDDIIKKNDCAGPFLIKIDVQGAEHIVLNGANLALKQTEVVILEVQLFKFFENGWEFSDTISLMKNKGFSVYDIFEFGYRPLDNALASVDIVFVKDAGLFRRSHHWASFEQRTQIEN